MSRTQVFLRNIISNWVGFAVQAAVVFFLTPYVLRTLGDSRYGVWILISSITGSYGLLALGFQSGVNQYLTRYLARHEYEKMNVVASTATVVLTCVGLTIAFIALVLAWLAPRLFNVPAALEAEVFWCIVIVSISVAIQMSLFVFSVTLMSTQRFDLSNIVGVLTRLLSAAMIVTALQLGWGLVGISMATAVSNVIDYCARWCLAYRVIPELQVKQRLATGAAFREMFSFGSWSFLITIAQTIYLYLDSLVIGAVMPISALAPYSLAAGLIRQLESLFRPTDHVFFPAVTQLHARDELDTLRAVYLRGSRILLLIVATSSVLAGFLAKDFFRLWVGERFVSGQDYPSVAILFYILLFAMCGRLFPGIGASVLQASMRIKLLALLLFLEALTNCLLSIILVYHYGLVGVAFATLISTLVFRSFTIPLLLSKQLGVPLSVYVRQTALRPLAVAAMLSVAMMCIIRTGRAYALPILLMQGASAALIAMPLALFIGLTQNDRKQFVYQPFRALIARISNSTNSESKALKESTEPHSKLD